MGPWLSRIQRRDDRFDRRIDLLDAQRDAHQIVDLLSNHLFPLDIFVSTELAQFRTFAIPTISALLHGTAQYERDGARRLDDTKAILMEIMGPGPSSPEGREMVDHLNRIHGHYRISNDDFLFTLSVFVVDPTRWIEKWGWRPLRTVERDALFHLYRELGQHMGIQALPDTYEALATWRDAYEARTQRYTPANEAVARGLITALSAFAPERLRVVTEPVIAALLPDDTLVSALGLKRPSVAVHRALTAALRTRQRVRRHVTPWNELKWWDTAFMRTYPTYPSGYERMRLGPHKVVARLQRSAG